MRIPLYAVGIVLLVAAAVLVWKRTAADLRVVEKRVPSLAETYPGLNLADPKPSFAMLRYVTDKAGDLVTRDMAIVWLDNQALLGAPPSPELETWLMDMLASNGHPDWDPEYRLWLFNSAFNVMHLGADQESFSRLLHKLALHDSFRTMRLYALQHIGLQRADGRLTGSLAEEIHTSLREFTTGSNGDVAGSAVTLLAEWDGSNTAAPDVLDEASKIAADSGRPVDVRLSAFHAAGSRALPLARELAIDIKEPVILRKSAISCIGRYGVEADTAVLSDLAAENARLAQAAQPALLSIRRRSANPNAIE
jgi:hypothetical protein